MRRAPATLLGKVSGKKNTKSMNYLPNIRLTAEDSKYAKVVTRRIPIAKRETQSRLYSKAY